MAFLCKILLFLSMLWLSYYVCHSAPYDIHTDDHKCDTHEILQGALREEANSLLEKFHFSWKNADPKKFPKVTLTPKQQAWFSQLGKAENGHTAPPKSVRKEIRKLSADEIQRFASAVWKMQTSFPDPDEPLSEYGLIVQMHRSLSAPAAHLGAGFLPWHREYLWRMEQAIRSHDPQVSLMYWDATLDQPLPEPRDSILWSDLLMGNVVGQVNTGPFANWSIIPECKEELGSLLTRNAPSNILGFASFLHYNDNRLQSYFNRTEFKMLVFPEHAQFENEHGHGHIFVSGHMGIVECSPSDPVFWSHHSFIDFIWEEFRQNSQVTDKELEYPTGSDQDIGGEEHEAYGYMEPFQPLYNIHGLGNHYTNYYYTYEQRPILCHDEEDCDSIYLWCNTNENRCTSKVKPGGKCNDMPDEACYGSDSKCSDRVCTL